MENNPGTNLRTVAEPLHGLMRRFFVFYRPTPNPGLRRPARGPPDPGLFTFDAFSVWDSHTCTVLLCQWYLNPLEVHVMKGDTNKTRPVDALL